MPDLANLPAFTAGQTVTHATMNAAFAALTVSTDFHTVRSTLATYATSVQLMVYDPASATFKKGTLANVVFNNDELIYNRTNSTAPDAADVVLMQNPSTKAFTRVPRQNLFGGMWAFTNVLAAAGALGHTAGDSLTVKVDTVTLEINGSNQIQVKDASLEVAKLTSTAKRNLAGALAVFQDQQAANTAAQASTTSPAQMRLNTTVCNTLTGCSLSSNQVTLAAGRYEVTITAHALNGVSGYVELYNVTDAITQVTTSGAALRACHATGLSGGATFAATGIIELATSNVLELRGRTSSASTFGSPINLGVSEQYQRIAIRQAY